MPDEQLLLHERALKSTVVIGLICGSDGIAALPHECYRSIAAVREAAVHIACFRQHGQHYEVSGPDGRLQGKIAPSKWQNILD